jgi:CheY-like chemotaxis protein
MYSLICVYVVDVILMDNMMPIMNGPNAAKMIREAGMISAIMITLIYSYYRFIGYKGFIFGATGNALPEDIKDFLDHGANRVMIKPMSIDLFKSVFLEESIKLKIRGP